MFQGGTFYNEVDANLKEDEKQEWLSWFAKFDKSYDIFGKIMVEDLAKLIKEKDLEDLTEKVRDKIFNEMQQEGYLFRPIDHHQWSRQQQQASQHDNDRQYISTEHAGLDDDVPRHSNSPTPFVSQKEKPQSLSWLKREEFLVFVVRWKQRPKPTQCGTQ
ncbi:hypothetical protein RFI_19802 [Reticulomyxa filosa]|uniref:Uncharacterized protein n=1 Tax=Reticulomyxa filosa TaxID=46433 RepID=X6MU63_RETFI|nr:hypothetical protein RFI_19802 [Reticulomyxa filosa]|eukprot:ETO17518.1 hypothetical protein RFI_19802 [Reticulomyxa filosa]